MAVKRQTPTTTPTTTPTGYAGGGDASQVATGLGLDTLPTASPSGITLQPGAPIDVPRYATDPVTGLIATVDVPQYDKDNKPILDPKTGQQVTQKQYAPWTAIRRPQPGPGLMPGIGTPGGAFGGLVPGSAVVTPQYFEGDDVGQLGQMLPEDIWTLQQNMATAGLYGTKPNYLPGRADDSTIAAYRKAMGVGNATGNDVSTVIQNWMELSKSAPKAPPPPHTNVLTNPTDLAAVFKNAALSTLGRSLTAAETQRYVSAFQTQEATYQDASAAAQNSGATTNVTAAPDPTNFLSEQLQQNNPGEYQQNSLLNSVNKLRSFLAGPGRVPEYG